MKPNHKILKTILCLAAMLFLHAATAQPPATTANRVLFIVETSKAMKPRLPAAKQSVQDLLESGLTGQLKPGDTLGIWTYDSELRAGVFPMQIWTEEHRSDIAKAAGEFLGRQKPKDRAQLAAVLPALQRLVEGSEAITILLYSDGSQPIQGTPFDESINEAYKQHREELRKAQLPFVTVLIGRNGKIVKCSMNSSVGVSVPALPLPEPPKPAKVTPVASVPPPPPVRTNPPLIVDYSKSNLVATASGGARTREIAVEAPMAKAGAGSEVATVAVLPKVQPEPSVPKESAPSPAASPPAAEVAVQTSAAPAVVIPPPAPAPPATVVQTPPPLVVSPQSNEVATPVPAVQEHRGNRSLVVAGLLGLLVAGGILIGWIWGASRSRNKGSLITKSFDRGKK